ncbi:MAG: DUF4961 domain-containing protein [Mucilaginibacter sp.]
MRSYLRIKGKGLWSLCAVLLIGVLIASCDYFINSVTQPLTAKANTFINVKVSTTIKAQGNDAPLTSMIFGILVPKGWDLRNDANISVKYTGSLEDNVTSMQRVPSNTLATNGNGLTWEEAFKKQYGTGGNFIDDVEWIIFETNHYVYLNNETINGAIDINMKVGADNNNANVTLVYAYTDDKHGFVVDAALNPAGYYVSKSVPCFQVTDGSSGELIDYCHPQRSLTTPSKITKDDFLTFTYNGNIEPGPLTKLEKVYLSAVGYDSDGNMLTTGLTQNAALNQTTSISGIYSASILPSEYFVIPAGKTLRRISYYYTNNPTLTRDDDGAAKVGLVSSPFTDFTFIVRCE